MTSLPRVRKEEEGKDRERISAGKKKTTEVSFSSFLFFFSSPHMYTHTYIHTYIHTYTYVATRIHKYTCMRACASAYTSPSPSPLFSLPKRKRAQGKRKRET